MRTPLLIPVRPRLSWLAVLLLWALSLLPHQGQAQLYYAVNDGSGTTQFDELRRSALAAASETSQATNFAYTPSSVAVDVANNRVFVTEARSGFAKIYAVSTLSPYPVTTFLTPAVTGNGSVTAVTSLAVDATNSFLYYTVNDGSGTTQTDELRRSPLAAASETSVATNFMYSPGFIAVDASSNRVLVAETRAGFAKVYAVSTVSPYPATTFLTPATTSNGSTTATVGGLAVDATNSFLYYTVNDGSGTTQFDELRRSPLAAASETSVATGFVFVPGAIAVDAANSRIFVAEARPGFAKIYAVGTASPYPVSTFLTPATTSNGSTTAAVTGLALPAVAAAASTTVASITTSTTSPTNASTSAYTVTFGASVSGLSLANFSLSPSVTGASISSLAGSGTTYTVVVNTGSGNGSLQLNLANAASITPAVSNAPYAGPAITIDKTAPTATLSSSTGANGSTSSTSPFSYTVTFSESVTGFSVAGITVTSGTLAGFSGSGSTYSFNVTPSGNGVVNVSVAANVAQDAAGNGNTAASQFAITYSQPVTAAPVVTTPANGSLLNSSMPTYSGTAPTGSTVTVSVDGTSIGTATATGGNFSLAQPTALALGSHSVRATAQLSGQAVSANSYPSTFTVDTTPPTVSLTSSAGAAGSTTSTSPVPFTVTFSKAVTGFLASEVTVTNGTLSGFSSSGTTYTFSVTPTSAGTATTVAIAANVAQDAAGNGNTASSSYSLTYMAPVTLTVWTANGLTTDWFNAQNWSAGVPLASLSALIPVVSSGIYPLLNAGEATTLHLSLNSGATLMQSGGTLDVRGNLTNNGTFSATGGTAVLGTTAVINGPTISGSSSTRFWNLTVQANGVLLSTPAGAVVQRQLLLNGSFGTQSNPLTLESNASGTAMVINNGGVVNGPVTVQRYIDPSNNAGLGYRHFAAPVTNTSMADLATGSFAPTLNGGYNTSATPNYVTPFPTVFGYDEARQASSPATTYTAFDKGWFSPADLPDALVSGHGYTVNLAAGQTVDFVGTLGNGNVALNLTRGRGPDAGWNLLGNPYPSTLDWTKVTRPQGVDDALYVYQSTSQYGGAYRSFVNGVGTTSTIALGQGFFVRVSEGTSSAQLTLTNSARTTDFSSNAVFQGVSVELRPRLQLTLHAATGPLSDATYVYFEEGSTSGVDAHYDAVKLPNPNGLSLSSLAAGRSLAINGLPLLDATSLLVPLQVAVPQAGSYSLQVSELLNFSPGTSLYLRDNELRTSTLLTVSTHYTFTLSSAAAPGRFALEFRPNSVMATAAQVLAQQVQVYPNPAQGRFTLQLPTGTGEANLTLTNALGQVMLRQAVRGDQATVEVPGLTTGVYVLRVQTATTTLSQRLVLH